MKKLSIIFTIILVTSIISSSFVAIVYCAWRTPTQLTSNTVNDYNPSISGDGTKIAFYTEVNGDEEIFIIDSDGTNLTQLTNNTAIDRYPSISNDGTKITFESNVDGDWEIFVINSDGTGLTQLTDNTLTDAYPAISGDGTKIVYRSIVDGTYELFLVNSDGLWSPIQLTSNQATVRIASISRDGAKIAFESNVDGDWEIFVINSDGTGLTQLTNNSVTDRYPSITYDGSEIGFCSDTDGDLEIFVINSDGSGSAIKLSSNIVNDLYPSVNGYGQKIAYISGDWGEYEIVVVTREDPSPPVDTMLSINEAAAITYSRSVTLTLSATDPDSGITEMRLANDGEAWSDWMHYVTSKPWILTSGDGEKRIWVEFKNGDGIGSTPASDSIILDTTPSMNHDVVYDQVTYVVQTHSNSTLTDLEFHQAESLLQFSVEGATGTAGFCNITIPSELMSGTFSIFKDTEALVEGKDYMQSFNGTHYQFNLTYDHSAHTIEIFATTVIPELTSLMLLAIFSITTAAIIVYQKTKTQLMHS